MGKKIVTEAMRKATPPLPGSPRLKQGGGQRGVIHHAAAAYVDQRGGGFHERDFNRADEVF